MCPKLKINLGHRIGHILVENNCFELASGNPPAGRAGIKKPVNPKIYELLFWNELQVVGVARLIAQSGRPDFPPPLLSGGINFPMTACFYPFYGYALTRRPAY